MMRRTCLAGLLAVFVLGVDGEPARGTSVDGSPKHALVLGKAKQVLVVAAMDRLASYRVEDGALVRTFQARTWVESFDASPDERLLACAGYGHVAVWDLRTGQKVWEAGPDQTDMRHGYD